MLGVADLLLVRSQAATCASALQSAAKASKWAKVRMAHRVSGGFRAASVQVGSAGSGSPTNLAACSKGLEAGWHLSQQRGLIANNTPLMKQSSALGFPSHVQASTAPDIPAINGEQIAKKIAKVS